MMIMIYYKPFLLRFGAINVFNVVSSGKNVVSSIWVGLSSFDILKQVNNEMMQYRYIYADTVSNELGRSISSDFDVRKFVFRIQWVSGTSGCGEFLALWFSSGNIFISETVVHFLKRLVKLLWFTPSNILIAVDK